MYSIKISILNLTISMYWFSIF